MGAFNPLGRVGTGTAGAESRGGWLMFDTGYEDVAFFSRFRCDGACNAGILLRAERTPTGWKGILVSLRDGEVVPLRVTLDDAGRIVAQEPTRNLDENYIPPPWAEPVEIVSGQWNSIEIFLVENEIQTNLNGVRGTIPGGTAQPESESALRHGFGPVALYVGSGRVAFDNVSTKDLLRLDIEPERTSSRFRVQQVNEFAYAWGADVGDVNGDGNLDLIARSFYYLGPDFRTRHEYYASRAYNPGEQYVHGRTSIRTRTRIRTGRP